jgi:hypothetical protein
MVCVDIAYLILFARVGLFHCMAAAALALMEQLLTMVLLWTNHVTAAKCVVVWNWFSTSCLITLALSSESGVWVMAAPFGLM